MKKGYEEECFSFEPIEDVLHKFYGYQRPIRALKMTHKKLNRPVTIPGYENWEEGL